MGPPEILAENRENQEVQLESKNVYRLREIFNSVMLRTNNYEKARRVVARILAAYKKLIPVGEQQLNVEASEQNVAYTNPHQELRLDELPWAQATTPTRSLPPTRRPARAGGQCRAGLSSRLASLAIMLCLIPCHSPCANPELIKKYEMEFLKDVVDPRYPFGPLSVLPQNEAKYEKVSLGKASDNHVLPKNVDARGYHSSPLSVEPRVPPGPLNVDARGYHSSPLSTPSQQRAPGGDRGPQYPLLVVRAGAQPPGGGGRPPVSLHAHLHQHKTKDLPQCEIKSKDLSLDEHKKKGLPQREVKSESLSLSEPEYKKDSQNVNKFKRISQSKMSMTEALSGVLNVMKGKLSDLVYPGSSSISPRSVNKSMTTDDLPLFFKGRKRGKSTFVHRLLTDLKFKTAMKKSLFHFELLK